MGGVDLCDQFVESCGRSMKGPRWYMKIFFYLLEVSTLNSFVIFKSIHKITKPRRYPFRAFKLELIKNLVSKGLRDLPPARTSTTADASSASRLDGKFHSLVDMDNRTTCKVHVQRKQCMTMCKDCGVAMCATPCFTIYHTHKKPTFEEEHNLSPRRVMSPNGRPSKMGRPRTLSNANESPSGSPSKKKKLP